MEDELEKKRKIEANAQKIADSATVRNKLAQQADSIMSGSGDKIKDKKNWLDFKKNSEEGNPQTPLESFMEGMAYFTPELMGGLFGSWAHSPEAARKLMKPIRDAEAKLDTGLSTYQKASLAMQESRLDQRKRETDLMTGRFSVRQKQRQMEQIAKKEEKEDVFARSKRNLTIMKDILQQRPTDFTGPVDALKQRAKQVAGKQDIDFTKFQQAATDFTAMYVKEISGVAVSEQEQKRLKQALPNIGTQENVNMTRIESLLNLMDMIEARNAKIKARVGGIPKGKTVKDYIRKDEEIDIDAVLGKGKSKKVDERSDFERLKAKFKRK